MIRNLYVTPGECTGGGPTYNGIPQSTGDMIEVYNIVKEIFDSKTTGNSYTKIQRQNTFIIKGPQLYIGTQTFI